MYLMKEKHEVRDVSKARVWFENVEHAMSLRQRCEAERKELQSLTNVIREMFGVRNEVSHFTATDVVLNTEKLKEYVEQYDVVVKSKLYTEFDSHGHIQQVWVDIMLFSAIIFIVVILQSMAHGGMTRATQIVLFQWRVMIFRISQSLDMNRLYSLAHTPNFKKIHVQ